MVISQLKLTSPLRDRQVKQEQSDTGDQCMMIFFHLSQNCEFGGAKFMAMKLLKNLLECDWNFSFTLWKIQGQREKFHAVKKVTVTEYLLLWNKVVMSEKISRYITEWTSYINIILLPEHYALTVSRRLQKFHCRHYWMSLRMGYLSANRQLAVKAILPFVYFSVFYCGFGETWENKMTEEKNFADTKTWKNTRHPSKSIHNNHDKCFFSHFSGKKHATSICQNGFQVLNICERISMIVRSLPDNQGNEIE